MTRRAVHQVDGGLAIVDARVFITAREIEFQAGQWLPARFQFRTLNRRVEVEVDRGAIDDLRNLVALVIVIEDVAIQRQPAIEQRVLGSEFVGIDEFRREMWPDASTEDCALMKSACGPGGLAPPPL